MADGDARVAVYIDFDNVVISRYNALHGRNAFFTDRARSHRANHPESDPAVTQRIDEARIDIGALLDYSSAFGVIALSRAYADWSAPINAGYATQLGKRAVDLTQMFTTPMKLKNSADIRLAVDVVEDLFRLPEISHVVIVAGDSDYIPLAQRCKRLGRYVVGIGVAGATSAVLAAACDEFAGYEALPGIHDPGQPQPPGPTSRDAPPAADAAEQTYQADSLEPADADSPEALLEIKQRRATEALLRAVRMGMARADSDWVYVAQLKPQMQRMEPAFQETELGYASFRHFLLSRSDLVTLEVRPNQVLAVRLNERTEAPSGQPT